MRLNLVASLQLNSIYVVEIVSVSFNEAIANFTNLIKCVICTLYYEYSVDNVWQEL